MPPPPPPPPPVPEDPDDAALVHLSLTSNSHIESWDITPQFDADVLVYDAMVEWDVPAVEILFITRQRAASVLIEDADGKTLYDSTKETGTEAPFENAGAGAPTEDEEIQNLRGWSAGDESSFTLNGEHVHKKKKPPKSTYSNHPVLGQSMEQNNNFYADRKGKVFKRKPKGTYGRRRSLLSMGTVYDIALQPGWNKINIKVTSQDKSQTITYALRIGRSEQPQNADLVNLDVSPAVSSVGYTASGAPFVSADEFETNEGAGFAVWSRPFTTRSLNYVVHMPAAIQYALVTPKTRDSSAKFNITVIKQFLAYAEDDDASTASAVAISWPANKPFVVPLLLNLGRIQH